MIGKLFLSILLLSVSTIPQEGSAEKEVGTFYTCAHGVKGTLYAKNDHELVIKGFHFDGLGPAPWFHGMLKGATTVNSVNGKFKTLPNQKGECAKAEAGNGETVELTLPESIKNFETIGILCYKACNNFGHVIIPKDLDVPAAPAGKIGKACPDLPKWDNNGTLETVIPCEKTKQEEVKSTCPGGGNPGGTGGANQKEIAPILGIIAVLCFFLGRPNFR